MRQAVVPSQYLQIALDLATRIAQGELTEGSRIYGRSVLASEYGYPGDDPQGPAAAGGHEGGGCEAPERGCSPPPADSARRYIENFSEDADTIPCASS